MIPVTLLLPMVFGLLLLACSGSDPPPPSPTTALPTPIPGVSPTASAAPTSTPWPQLAVRPVAGNTITERGAYLFDTFTDSIIRIGDRRAEFSPDGTRLAAGLCCIGQGFLDVLELGTGRSVRHTTGDVTAVAWSPDSRQIAFAVNAPPDIAGVHVIARDGTGVRKLTSHTHISEIVWLTDDEVGFYAGRPGEEGARYYAVRVTTAAVQELFEIDPLASSDPRILFGKRSPSGDWTLIKDGDSTFVWNRTTAELLETGGLDAHWSPLEDKLLVFSVSNDAANPAISVLDPRTRRRVMLAEAGLWSHWMPDGKVASVDYRCSPPLGSGGGGGSRRIVRIEPATGATTPLTPPDGPFGYELAVSPTKTVAAYVSRDNSEYYLNLIDLSSGAVSVAAVAPDVRLDIHVHGTEAWTPDGRYVQFHVSGGHGICD